MHPFYGPSSQQLRQRTCSWVGLASMMAYLLFWAAALPIAIRTLSRLFRQAAGSAGPDTAAVILRERYARGEIELDEFQRKTAVLERKG